MTDARAFSNDAVGKVSHEKFQVFVLTSCCVESYRCWQYFCLVDILTLHLVLVGLQQLVEKSPHQTASLLWGKARYANA